MTLKEVLGRATASLAAAGVEDATFEAGLLLRESLHLDRTGLFLRLDEELDAVRAKEFMGFVSRRTAGEPAAYITGRREFYGLDFKVGPEVLIPRPETELLVEKAIEAAAGWPGVKIADIGTGSGAVAVSLAVNLPGAIIYATDISEAALQTARENCRRHGVGERVRLLYGDLLEPLPEPVDIIVANLPYVPTGGLAAVNTAGYEPALALDGGADGLREIRRLLEQAPARLWPEGCLLMEIGQGHDRKIQRWLDKRFPSIITEFFPDLSGIIRIMHISLACSGAAAQA